ncbi:hypothetical protein NEOLEDRAFT_1036442, partial [Neolentinus lepideus HHB14362 ss-1]
LCVSLFALMAMQNLTDNQLTQIENNLTTGVTHSWEIGTHTEALTEFLTPSYSIFSSSSIPLSSSQFTYGPPSSLDPILTLAHSVIANRSTSNDNAQGPQPFMQDTATSNPVSIGVAVLIANWTGYTGYGGAEDYVGVAWDQVDYLFSGSMPKMSDGAILHHVSQLQLWSDLVYMVLLFLAYYSVTTTNRSEWFSFSIYCPLCNSSTGGMWKHIMMGSGMDSGHWATGNSWAAAGMLCILRTITNSQYANTMKSEQTDLVNWVGEIHNGIYLHLQSNGLFKNYPNSSNTSNFNDAASTALLASTMYHLANTWGWHTHLLQVECSWQVLSSSNSTLAHFTSDMWLMPVVDPYNFGQQGEWSQEVQAFVLEMEAARGDWVMVGSQGA